MQGRARGVKEPKGHLPPESPLPMSFAVAKPGLAQCLFCHTTVGRRFVDVHVDWVPLPLSKRCNGNMADAGRQEFRLHSCTINLQC
jgi:hypothetical protein